MGKGKVVLAAVTVIFGAIMSIAPPLAAWYTGKKEEQRRPKVLRPAKEGKVPRKVIEEAVRKVVAERDKNGEA